jgi:hypothetical protein
VPGMRAQSNGYHADRMDRWQDWPYGRIYLLLVAVAFVVVGIQVFLFHWRAAFRSKTMYGPVVLAPVVALAGIAAAAKRDGAIGWIALAIFGLAAVEGVIGLVLHLRGIGYRVGGFTWRNVVAGPPPMLPLAFGALGVTGGLAVVWHAL